MTPERHNPSLYTANLSLQGDCRHCRVVVTNNKHLPGIFGTQVKEQNVSNFRSVSNILISGVD